MDVEIDYVVFQDFTNAQEERSTSLFVYVLARDVDPRYASIPFSTR